MDELTRGKYFDKKEVLVEDIGLSVIRGFKFTLETLKSGIVLQIDVCSRVYRSHNLLQELSTYKSKDAVVILIGASVITNYGKRKTYRIEEIDYNLNPRSKFYHDKRAGQVTFAEYYEECYGLRVSTMKQPLILTTIRVQKQLNKQGYLEKKEIKGYLIPEFISLTGMSDEQRSNFQTMKKIAPYTKLSPEERMKKTGDIVQTLNDSDNIHLSLPQKIKAYQLVQPYVKVQGTQVVKNHGDGSMNIRDKLRSTVNFKDWVVVYSTGKNAKIDDRDADDLANLLGKASEAFGVKFEEPGFITCSQNVQDWKKELAADIEKNGKPQIIVLFFNPFEEKFYGEMKRFITCELKIPCQVIRKKTVLKAKNPMSAASKIVIQMNQKVGGTAWEIIPQEGAYTSKKRTMYGSFAISKGKKGFTMAFTGTVNNEFTKVFNYCKTGYKSKDDIPQADF